MNEHKDYTDWMRGQYQPHRLGVFQRDYDGRYWFSYWNGSYWGQLRSTAYAASCASAATARSLHQDLPWRGLTRNPE